jgi:putative membrane protein
MKALTSPTIIILGLFLFWERWRFEPKQRKKLILWSLFVLIGSYFAEWIGIKTGSIFGNYSYGKTLYPIINQVPITIGFAWLVMLFSSFAVVHRYLGKYVPENIFLFSFCVSMIMVAFDVLMEPAAVKLFYWRWNSNRIPIQNYLAWYIISYIFSTCALSLKLFQKKISTTIAVHVYFAQLIYFAMVVFGK